MARTHRMHKPPPASGSFPVASGHGEEDFEAGEFLAGSKATDVPLAVNDVRIPAGVPFEGPTRILVVSVSLALREETVRLLATEGGAGWEPDAVGEVARARTRLMLEAWDLVLLRLDGGPLDYRDVFRSIRAARRWPSPPVVVVLEPDPAAKAELTALGAFRILETPVAASEILETVRHGLAAESPSRSPRWDTERADDGEHASEGPLL